MRKSLTYAAVFALISGFAVCSIPVNIDAQSSFGDDEVAVVPGNPVSVYTSVARAMRTCWFNGPRNLRAFYVFRAKVSPASAGGTAQIGIYTKGPNGKKAQLAFGLDIERAGEESRIAQKNRLFGQNESRNMRRDVLRWARRDLTCGATAQEPATVKVPLPVRHPRRRKRT